MNAQKPLKTLKALSLLLSYPDADVQQEIPAIRAALREGLLSDMALAAIEPLLQALASGDLYDLEERYVLLFDRSRSLSLNLFEHVHGESRDRGGAMVDLLNHYRMAGFDLATTELPDHLPVLLEFLSTQPKKIALAMLADTGAILFALAERHQRRESLYAPVFQILAALAHANPDDAEAQTMLAADLDDPEDFAALDRAWEESEVTFGPDPAAGCPTPGTMPGAAPSAASAAFATSATSGRIG